MKKTFRRAFLLFWATGSVCLMRAAAASAPEVAVHEWGTFTSLQDEEGRTLSGINTDDEPVPAFVHDVSRGLLIHPSINAPIGASKGVNASRQDVTMRLETPVLYVHAPEDFQASFGVKVEFRGGWLTQFYPEARSECPGLKPEQEGFGKLLPEAVGSLEWTGVTLAPENARGPKTSDRVWLAPREVTARMLSTPKGESERFLFYRGVGNLDAPLQAIRNTAGVEIRPHGPMGRKVRKLWLVEILPNGTAAFRPVPTSGANAERLAAAPDFRREEFTAYAVEQLRAAMKTALVEEGLFDDEAEAMLNTWQISYFKSAGLRLFFITPPEWNEAILPLTLSGFPEETKITRVMVGRIELISPRQRAVLQKISDGGSESFEQEYAALGRFARPLLFDEMERRPSEGLKRFIERVQIVRSPATHP